MDIYLICCLQSLLDRKQRKEQEKVEAEKEETRKLVQEMEDAKKQQSAETIDRANKLMLYRKGLIRDFHGALAYSKVQNRKSSIAREQTI